MNGLICPCSNVLIALEIYLSVEEVRSGLTKCHKQFAETQSYIKKLYGS